jgi:hypothetical protein
MCATCRTERGRFVLFALCLLALSSLALAAGTTRAGVTVDGYGRDPKAALERAQVNAQDEVRNLVHQRLGPGWEPTLDQLRPEFLEREGVLRPRGEPKRTEIGGEPAYQATLDVELTGSFLAAVQNKDRQARIEFRQALLARILAELVVVLLVTTGYLRLEGLTAGYYTNLLRLGAVLVVALVGLGLWLTL